MASKRRSGSRPTKGSRNRKAADLQAAMANGRKQARGVLAYRAARRRRRASVLRSAGAQRAAPGPAALPPSRVMRALGPAVSTGVLIAEGDSWFDYPLHDVLEMLEDDFGYDVESVAHKGDRVEDMAYADGQFEELARRLEKLLRMSRVPKAILLSGGGNDLAGSEFALLLNHAASSLPPLNEDIIAGVIDQRLRDAYAHILSAITAISVEYLAHPIPIVIHGYDHPVPDGRGFLGGVWVLPGPWLQPGFRKKGYQDLKANTGYMKTLIDRFNAMLKGVSEIQEFGHVHYLDLRGTLLPTPYKDYWANELHPTKRGFGLVTAKFATMIASL
jgi:hypothetical protein